jgi:hypothetical protein
VSARGPIRLTNRSVVTGMSGRRREKLRTYPSISTASLAYPPGGSAFGSVASVNIAGSRGLAP